MISSRIKVVEIARRLGIGKMAVYQLLESHIIPGIRNGRRWLITRQAYEHWEQTCGKRGSELLTESPSFCQNPGHEQIQEETPWGAPPRGDNAMRLDLRPKTYSH